MVPSCTPPNGDLACNPGLCPDWEFNWRLFASQLHSLALNPLSHTSRGPNSFFFNAYYNIPILTAIYIKSKSEPWLAWLSGLSAGLQTKGHQFNSQSGDMPGLWARSPVGGARERQPHIDVSLPFSLPSSLSKNKYFFKKKK